MSVGGKMVHLDPMYSNRWLAFHWEVILKINVYHQQYFSYAVELWTSTARCTPGVRLWLHCVM